MLAQVIPVLDHGFIRVVDYMGDDRAVVQAARVSYGRGTKTRSEDRGLIRYLMAHRHSTPFEMCEIKYHIKLPIFIARQWIRHRTASVNEYSARYSVMDCEFYIPDADQLAVQSGDNRQGRGDAMNRDDAERVLELLRNDAANNYENYASMLDGGLSRELARMNLTLNTYTQWYWKIDLHNLLNFLSLRVDSHAQYEIRVYAEAMLKTVEAWVPYSYEAFIDYRMGAVTMSSQSLSIVRRMLAGEAVEREGSGLSKREWRELMERIGKAER
jgi:thymidylate synthase (FAD)